MTRLHWGKQGAQHPETDSSVEGGVYGALTSRLHDLPDASDGELEMLENVAAERRPNSRLACQIKARSSLEGLIVHLPATQE